MASCPTCPISKALPLILIVFAGVMVFQNYLSEPAPRPGMFSSDVRLNDAIDKTAGSEGESDLVFAVATADWCAPCQRYKRGALSDPQVQEWVSENTQPVYINVDKHSEEAQRLGVRGIPATFLLRDGEVVSRITGARSADDLLRWLKEQNASASENTRASAAG